ncbi:hypothetical protein I5M27_15205 [Adhaeribacter sp. BT258]|uniref:Uncharacterized protein n=1 Tax=Adhaeribacter terrigena TaxID=2793070 RepID=A0ABS1C4M9_9BACT|nr:hypothetical protein [Adhaeribacter terrigena]MBK0404344.1 hypothetical protein [Adhaeribacter terrigena]
MKNHKNESGERGHRNHLEGEGTKSDRQGGGPGERSSMAGEQGAKAEETNTGIRSHTSAGDVHGAGSLKDGSSNDQTPEERGTGLHLGDDYRIHKVTGEQDETVRRQTGTTNHEGGKSDGSGGGKSSGGAGHGSQEHKHAPSTYNDPHRGNNPSAWVKNNAKGSSGSSGTSGNPEDYEGYEGGTPPAKLKSGGDHQHGGEFPPRTRQNPNEEGSSAGSH